MKRNVILERDYTYPIETVWSAITDSASMSDWLMPNDFQPVVGHHFQFRTEANRFFDGIVDCEVLTVEPPTTLAYSWQGGPMKRPTTVTWTLTTTASGTHLKLAHTDFEGLPSMMVSVILGMGWRRILGEGLPAELARRSTATAQS